MSIQALLTEYGDKYLQALLTTWRLTAISFAAAFLIGVVVTVLRVCPIRPLRLFGDFSVQIFPVQHCLYCGYTRFHIFRSYFRMTYASLQQQS